MKTPTEKEVKSVLFKISTGNATQNWPCGPYAEVTRTVAGVPVGLRLLFLSKNHPKTQSLTQQQFLIFLTVLAGAPLLVSRVLTQMTPFSWRVPAVCEWVLAGQGGWPLLHAASHPLGGERGCPHGHLRDACRRAKVGASGQLQTQASEST